LVLNVWRACSDSMQRAQSSSSSTSGLRRLIDSAFMRW
jgi:hypothetical protein